MNVVFAFSHHTGIRLAEVAFLLILIAGVWLAVARSAMRTVGGGVLLAVAGLLLIVASHWGRFG